MKSKTIFSIISVFTLMVVSICGFVHEANAVGYSAAIAVSGGLTSIPAFGARQRAIFNYIQSTWGDPNNVSLIATPSFLRVEETLSDTTAKYNFNIVNNQGTIQGPEVKLNQNDVFIVTHIGMYFVQYPAIDGVIQKWTGILQTYPNDTELTGPTNPRDLNAYYNGTWSISVGRVKFFDKFPAHLQFKVPQTQQTTSVNYSQFEYTDGAPSIDPMAILSGAATNTIELNIPVGPTALQVQDQGTTSVTKVVFMPYGFLVNNAANFINY